MRHHNNVRKFGRKKNQRVALMRGLALSFFRHGQIDTTEAKAKELRPYVEKMITRAMDNTLTSRRILLAKLMNNEKELNVLINEIAPKYTGRTGGYTRITKLPARKSDGAQIAVIALVD